MPTESPRRPPAPSATFFLINMGRRAQRMVETRLAEQGLAYHHVAALGHLRGDPGLSYSELARRAGVSVQSMQATIAYLQDQKLVRRDVDAVQGRRAELDLTSAGVRALITSETAIRAVDDELLFALDPAERTGLEQTLGRLFRPLSEARVRPPRLTSPDEKVPPAVSGPPASRR